MIATASAERDLVAQGDRRERSVPCPHCRQRLTLAICPLICSRCLPAEMCECGADISGDAHTQHDPGCTGTDCACDGVACESCCTTCSDGGSGPNRTRTESPLGDGALANPAARLLPAVSPSRRHKEIIR